MPREPFTHEQLAFIEARALASLRVWGRAADHELYRVLRPRGRARIHAIHQARRGEAGNHEIFRNLVCDGRNVLRCLFTKRHSMKTYHGERTEQGCEVTVDGQPLRMCSNLSGNATTAFDWGYVGTGQLSLALLSNLLGNDTAAMSMSDVFEREVVAHMPHERWTMTDHDLSAALAPLVGLNGARAGEDETDATAGAAFGDMPVETDDLLPTTLQAEDAAANASMVSRVGTWTRRFLNMPRGLG